MDLGITSLQNKIRGNSCFSIEDSRVFIDTNGDRVNLNFDQITNVRLIEKQEFITKSGLVFLAILFYSFCQLFFNEYFVVQLISLIIMCSSIASTVFTKRFSYRLLVNKRIDGFNEF
jgi:dolichol kinase